MMVSDVFGQVVVTYGVMNLKQVLAYDMILYETIVSSQTFSQALLRDSP